MNIALLFAAGRGTRMGITEKPKQFLEFSNKPVIIHTINAFEKSKAIDKILVVTLDEYISYTWNLINNYNIKKVYKIIKGGNTGQQSIFEGIKTIYNDFGKDSIVLINDGVRPFISEKLIEENIDTVKREGSSVSAVYATETIALLNNSIIKNITNRDKSAFLKAPQSFWIQDIYENHLRAINEKKDTFVDSASLMNYYGKKLAIVLTDYDNIKITTQKDIVLAESIYERRENNE